MAEVKEPTIESLQAELAKTKESLKLSEGAAKQAQTELSQKVAELGQANEAIARLTKAASESEAASVAIIDELKAQITESQNQPGIVPRVKSGKDTYEVLQTEFVYGGKLVTLDELKTNEKLVATLVEIGASYLRKVEKK